MGKFLEKPLREFSKKDIYQAIEKLEECEELISEELVECVEIYEGIPTRKINVKEKASKSLSRIINRINTSDGWNVFIQFFDIKTQDNEFPKFTMVLPLLENHINPILPWSEPTKCHLFKEKTENLLLNPGVYDINFEEFLGSVITFDPVVAETIKRMQLGVHRNKDIIHLLMNLSLMEALDLKPKLVSYTKNGQIDKEILSPKIEGSDLKSYVKDIFLKHYFKEKKNVEKQKIFPEEDNIDERVWCELKDAGSKLKNSIVKIKDNYLNSIINHQFSEKLQVFNEIRNFLQAVNLDEETLISIPELQSKYKAYGLVKKISKGPGMAIVKKEYLSWLRNEKIKESERINHYIKRKTIKEFALARRVDIEDINEAIKKLKIIISKNDPRLTFEDEELIQRYLAEKNQGNYQYNF